MTINSDNFKDFFKDTKSNIIILISFTFFMIFYITLKATDMNNKIGIISLQVLSFISMMTFIISIVKKFMPTSEETILQKIIFFLMTSLEYIKTFFFNIFNFLKEFFINLIYSSIELFSSIIFPDIRIVSLMIAILLLLALLGYTLYSIGIDINFEGIKQYTEFKKILYSIFIFLAFGLVLFNIIPKLYSSDKSPNRKLALIVALILLISIILGGFFINEINSGNYRNYGMLLFNVLIFCIFIYLIYGIKKFFFDPKSPTLENYSVFEYFLYYYLFPIIFFIGYILYYIFVYRAENLSFTDFSDYRVIFFDIFTAIIGIYLIYQVIIKNLSFDSSILHFIQSVFKVIPCILSVFVEYLIKNPLGSILSIVLSTIFILLMINVSGGSLEYDSWYMILLYIIGSIATIAGIIKVLLATTNLGESKVFELLKKTIFALPCLFLLGTDNAFKGQKFGTTSEFLFIVLIIFFIFFYNAITTTIVPEVYEKYILSGGKQVINKPISLTKYTFVSSYEDLFNFNNTQSEDIKNPTKFDYKYGLSFWVYFNSFTPLNSQLYNVCSLGDGLMIKYNPVENTLYFMYNKKTINQEEKKTEKNKKNDKENFTNFIENLDINKEETNNEQIEQNTNKNKKSLTMEGLNKWQKISRRNQLLEKFKNNNRPTIEGFQNNDNTSDTVIIYKQKDILLQKWNNIIVNYYGGTLDIFINGKIVGSKINVAPYITNTALTLGMDNGTNGDVCNLIYYKSPMSKSDIYRMYHIFKDKNPPIINKSDTNIINFGKTLNVYFSELLNKNK
jgi:hypothetical protein